MVLFRSLVLATAAALPAAAGCGDGGPPAEEPVAAPPPRCADLEAKMLECAGEAAGLEALPESVAAGVREAASLNCRRMRSASHDPDLPARVMAACGGEPCNTFPACVNREAGPDVVLAAREANRRTGDGPPDLGALVGSPSSFARDGTPTSKSFADLCGPFVEKLLACAAERAGGAFGQAETDVATRAFLDGCDLLVAEPEATLTAALAACADAPCAGYGACVAERLDAAGAEP